MSNLSDIVVLSYVFTIFSLANGYKLENNVNDVVNLLTVKNGYEVNIGPIIEDNIDDIQGALQIIDPTSLKDIKLLENGHLTDGWLHKLSKIHRTGACNMKYSDKVIRINLNMGWEGITYHYNYDIKLWFIQRNGRLRGSVDKLRFNVALQIDFNTYTLTLEHFKVPEIGKLDLDLEGTYGDELRSIFGKLIMNLAKKQIVKTVETVATNIIEETLNNINEQIPNHDHQFKFVNLVNNNNFIDIL